MVGAERYAEIVINELRKRYPDAAAMRVNQIQLQADHAICVKIALGLKIWEQTTGQ